MVKAATTGAIDFARADLRDRWWWHKLRLTLLSLQAEEEYQLTESQHRHWVGFFSNSALTEDSFAVAKENSQRYLHELICHRYPEFREYLRQHEFAQSREGLLSEFRETYGYPGDPRYEEMLRQQDEAFRRLREEQPNEPDYDDF